MRLLLTADLHYNHPKSRDLATAQIRDINRAGADAIVVIGDTAVADGEELEQCLSLFTFNGPKLFIAGNHELWTNRDDSYSFYTVELPRRVRNLGWHWLEDEPFSLGDVAIVGSVGWYDYSHAQPSLQIPRRFYEHKVSPGAAAHLAEYGFLLEHATDVTPRAMQIIARWNDGKYVKLHRSDEEFLSELLDKLDRQLTTLAGTKHIVAATHHLPFSQLLPPAHSSQWDFSKAYLGSDAIGRVLLKHENVRHAFCGHSHFPAETTVGHIRAVNIGSGYRVKHFRTLDI